MLDKDISCCASSSDGGGEGTATMLDTDTDPAVVAAVLMAAPSARAAGMGGGWMLRGMLHGRKLQVVSRVLAEARLATGGVVGVTGVCGVEPQEVPAVVIHSYSITSTAAVRSGSTIGRNRWH